MLLPLALLALQLPAAAGGPAPYWQQRVVYQIDARLDEPTATLGGTESVRYINNSPDTLTTISFHLYLNAFRPGSRWSAADAAERRHRFDTLRDPDFAFNHVRNVTIDGHSVTAIYPLQPDSTIVRFELPAPLAPGDSLDVSMEWDARPSTVPRRQGRRGRHYDFAQWYPKVVVYDTYGWEEHALYPAGEFYGEFGDFFVRLDVPDDEVIGATGTPVCGDPGWQRANLQPEHRVMRDADRIGDSVFSQARPVDSMPAGVCTAAGTNLQTTDRPAPGRKQLLWVARDVHNFAITMSPDYRYEGGEWNGIQVHVLYQPGDEATWGHGTVVGHTITTLRWLDFLFGTYPWPQMTVAHRIEGGGTEFPMMQMDGSPSLGLNLHEGGHSYLMGILANNEWREGWMDEGFTSFQTSWFESLQSRSDAALRRLDLGILQLDLAGKSQPVSTVSNDFRDFATYNAMIYNRGELVLEELHRMVGDSTMHEILRQYYAQWKLRHVNENAFRAVAEAVSHRDLKTFFAQWLHEVVLTDYAVTSADRQRTDGGEWQTTVHLQRNAAGQYPVTVAVIATSDTGYATATGIAEDERLVIGTRSEPQRVLVDPAELAHDWNKLNNQYRLSALKRLIVGNTPTEYYLDNFFSPHYAADHLTVGIMPTIWFNDASGLTLGVRARTDYFGQFDRTNLVISCGTGAGSVAARERTECGISASLENPTWLYAPGARQRLSAFRVEGRTGAGIAFGWQYAPHLGFGPTYTGGVSADWVATYDLAWLDQQRWSNGGTGEAALWWGVTDQRGGWGLSLNARLAGGVMYTNQSGGITTQHRYDAQVYGRPELTVTAARDLSRRVSLGFRGFAAGTFSHAPVLPQRRLFIGGADPYANLSNPFRRSTGSMLAPHNCSCRWQTPGGGDLRGYTTALSTDRMAAVNAELHANVVRTPAPLFQRLDFALFADVAWVGRQSGAGDATSLALHPPVDRVLADAGPGLRVTQRIGATTWTTRLDFPFYVSDPAWAFAHQSDQFALGRVVLSLSAVVP